MTQQAAPSGRTPPVEQGYNHSGSLPVSRMVEEARKAKGLSREELAYTSGVAFTTIWRAEAGYQLSADVIHRLAQILDLDAFDLHAAQGTAPPEIMNRIAQLSGDQMRAVYRHLEDL